MMILTISIISSIMLRDMDYMPHIEVGLLKYLQEEACTLFED